MPTGYRRVGPKLSGMVPRNLPEFSITKTIRYANRVPQIRTETIRYGTQEPTRVQYNQIYQVWYPGTPAHDPNYQVWYPGTYPSMTKAIRYGTRVPQSMYHTKHV